MWHCFNWLWCTHEVVLLHIILTLRHSYSTPFDTLHGGYLRSMFDKLEAMASGWPFHNLNVVSLRSVWVCLGVCFESLFCLKMMWILLRCWNLRTNIIAFKVCSSLSSKMLVHVSIMHCASIISTSLNSSKSCNLKSWWCHLRIRLLVRCNGLAIVHLAYSPHINWFLSLPMQLKLCSYNLLTSFPFFSKCIPCMGECYHMSGEL